MEGESETEEPEVVGEDKKTTKKKKKKSNFFDSFFKHAISIRKMILKSTMLNSLSWCFYVNIVNDMKI